MLNSKWQKLSDKNWATKALLVGWGEGAPKVQPLETFDKFDSQTAMTLWTVENNETPIFKSSKSLFLFEMLLPERRKVRSKKKLSSHGGLEVEQWSDNKTLSISEDQSPLGACMIIWYQWTHYVMYILDVCCNEAFTIVINNSWFDFISSHRLPGALLSYELATKYFYFWAINIRVPRGIRSTEAKVTTFNWMWSRSSPSKPLWLDFEFSPQFLFLFFYPW